MPPAVEVAPGDVASLIYTSGTTGRPKGVMLTHANFTSLVAALSPVFPLSRGDAVLSVLPLHHTFEFTCGLLLPLSRGARVVYLDELTGDTHRAGPAGLARHRHGRRTGAVAAARAPHPAAGRRAGGPLARTAFDVAGEINRWLSANVGLDAGRVLFGAVHARIGGHVKWLISGGAALPQRDAGALRGAGPCR